MTRSSALLAIVSILFGGQSAEWSTHRGNPSRTGSVDGKAGPTKPKVLWTHSSKEHFVASLVASGDRLYASALGSFNSGWFHAFDLADGPAKRVVWTKSSPLLHAPAVCAPAIVDGKVILGEGMHQTDGAGLLSFRATDGRLLWRLSVPGELTHIEGSPTVSGGRIFVGAGSAGVLCVDLHRVLLDGKEAGLAEAEASLDRKWKELVAKYEEEKKKDPDFAVPPNEISLTPPPPKLWWQVGKGKWHVDGPTALAEGKVLVGSAYLDKERTGERAIFCLNADDGRILWQTALKYNPWGGASIQGQRVLVSTSSIRYDPGQIAGAKGEVLALRLSDGAIEWRREVDAGVLGSTAQIGDLAIFTDTRGRLQALDATSGAPRWSYQAESAFFAGPAVTPVGTYAVDLKGVAHAVKTPDGAPLWKLDVAKAAGAPGMVYGSPALHQGRLYVGTGNIEGEAAGGPTFLACIGETD
jgi:outer membrane protein assembly factor BamB